MTRFDDYLAEQLQDPEFRAEWEALQPERAIVQAMIDAWQKTGLTQKQLAEKTGISQSDISKFETGSSHPSIATLKKIADGLGRRLSILLVDSEGEE